MSSRLRSISTLLTITSSLFLVCTASSARHAEASPAPFQRLAASPDSRLPLQVLSSNPTNIAACLLEGKSKRSFVVLRDLVDQTPQTLRGAKRKRTDLNKELALLTRLLNSKRVKAAPARREVLSQKRAEVLRLLTPERRCQKLSLASFAPKIAAPVGQASATAVPQSTEVGSSATPQTETGTDTGGAPELVLDQCNDGIDNDGDGLVDLADDQRSTIGAPLGCLGPNRWETSGPRPDGYRIYPRSGAGRIIYVSSSVGDDLNDGSAPYPVSGSAHIGPVRTLARGAQMMTADRGQPSWMLLNSCDDFVNQWIGGFYGLPDGTTYGGDYSGNPTTGEPQLFGAYGQCQRRPRIMPGLTTGQALYINNHDSHIVVTGLEFLQHLRDPASALFDHNAGGNAIVIMRASHDIVLEDNRIQFFNSGLKIQSVLDESCPQAMSGDFECDEANLVRNITIRRNLILDNYSTGSHAQGMFTEGVINLTIEENVFDHNGWSEHPRVASTAEATIYNHAMYLAHGFRADAVVRGNIVANSSATGVQLRAGGLVEDNLVLRNPLGITIGHDQNLPGLLASGAILNNVVLDARDIDNEPRGFGIAAAGAGVTIDGNVVAHQQRGSANIYGITIGGGNRPSFNLYVRDNVVYDWSNNGGGSGSAMVVDASINDARITTNQFVQPRGGFVYESLRPQMILSEQNTYYSSGAYIWGQWSDSLIAMLNSNTAAQRVSAATFFATVGDRGSLVSAVTFADPERSLETYMASLNREPSYGAFIQEARSMARGRYQPEFTASVANNYFRAGFAR